MARIALGITIALLLATCAFSYLTHTKIVGFESDIASLKTQLGSTQQRLAKTEADLKSSQSDLGDAKKQVEGLTTDLATAKTSLDAATAQVTDLNAKLAADDAKIKDLTSTTPGAGPAPAGPSQADYDKLAGQLKDATAQVAELTQVKETLTNKVKDAESRVDDLQKIVDHYKNIALRNGLEGEVLAVNPGWNFVVLSIGDRQGAVTNAEMILKRGNSQIGKVRITSVEPSTSVADIVPGSLSRGVRVQPGDRVIFLGATN